VCNYLNGAIIKTFPRHNSHVSCIHYCKEDKCMLSASWDRSIRLYDDDSSTPLLRCISDAHDSDIKCIAYSYALGLVASCSSDGIKIWDYIFFLLEDECSPKQNSDVTCMQFVEPYPLLLSAHENGVICFWGVRPWYIYGLLHKITIDPAHELMICSMQVYYDEASGEELGDGVTRGRHLVYVGDQTGKVQCWNISQVNIIYLLYLSTLSNCF